MKTRILALFLAALTLFSGCGNQAQLEDGAAKEHDPEQRFDLETESEPKPESELESEPELYVPSGTNPLTGLPMEPEYENDRPVAVMLNNLKAAQPQLGISKADIIYEVPAEGGITRMLAIYQTLEGVENLGSIRSTRPYYLELALGHDALLVHAGGSSAAYSNIHSWGVDNMDGVNGGSDAEIFWRDKERQRTKGYEHSMLTSGANIQSYLEEGHFRTEHKDGYTYGQDFTKDAALTNGTVAEHVHVKFSQYKTGIFDYDADNNRYLVEQYGQEYVDGNTGKQVSATNILILETSMRVLDAEGRLRVDLTGSGEGTYCYGGWSIPIRWSKADRNSPFVYTRKDGGPLALGQGNSYVCIISPKTGSVSIE